MPTPAALDDSRLTVTGLLFETSTGLGARLAPQLGEHGLSTVEFEVLVRLGRSPASRLRMSDLADQTSLSTSGVTRVVDRLERDGLVARQTCSSDRRGFFAVLTDAGSRRLAEVLPGHLELLERWFTGLLDPAALRALADGLRVVRDAVRPEAVAGSAGLPAGEPDRPSGARVPA